MPFTMELIYVVYVSFFIVLCLGAIFIRLPKYRRTDLEMQRPAPGSVYTSPDQSTLRRETIIDVSTLANWRTGKDFYNASNGESLFGEAIASDELKSRFNPNIVDGSTIYLYKTKTCFFVVLLYAHSSDVTRCEKIKLDWLTAEDANLFKH